MSNVFSSNNVLGFCIPQKVTIEGGPIDVNIVGAPINVSLDSAVTIDPSQLTALLNAISAPSDVNVTSISADSFDPLIETLDRLVVGFDNCACMLQDAGMPIEGTFIMYGDGSSKFVDRAGLETIDPDINLIQSKCCKAKPYAMCKGCYNGQTGIFFYMDDYTVNFIDDDNPTNLVLNIDRSKIECKGCETDPCCCYKANVMQVVHDQQVSLGALFFPGGAYEVDIRVDDPNPGAYILVNGETYLFNDRFNVKHQVNEVNNVHDFVPDVVIENPGGFTFEYTALYPSLSQANISAL